jgi:hypothetical protein
VGVRRSCCARRVTLLYNKHEPRQDRKFSLVAFGTAGRFVGSVRGNASDDVRPLGATPATTSGPWGQRQRRRQAPGGNACDDVRPLAATPATTRRPLGATSADEAGLVSDVSRRAWPRRRGSWRPRGGANVAFGPARPRKIDYASQASPP